MMRIAKAWALGFSVAGVLVAAQVPAKQPEPVSLPTQDGGLVHGDLYGAGGRGVVLAHGARFNKESWGKQAQVLAKEGFRVLAIDFRGYGKSTGPGRNDPLSAPLSFDVLAAVRYFHRTGAKTVSVVGGSMGGCAAADASADSRPGEIDRVVMIASSAWRREAAGLKGRKLFITCRDDLGAGNVPRLRKIRADYERAPQPKELVVLECSAHAQFIFDTAQGERLMNEILRFLSAP